MIWVSQQVLATLAGEDAAGLRFDQIAAFVTAGGNGLIDCLGRLRRRKLIELDARRYRLTAAGRAFLAAGKSFTSGAKGPHTGKRVIENTLRQRFWHAIYIRRPKFSAPEILERAVKGTEHDAEGNLRKYLRVLTRAGYLSELPTREREPAGAGHKRYLLVRYSGPRAPCWLPSHGIVFDPNDEQEYPL